MNSVAIVPARGYACSLSVFALLLTATVFLLPTAARANPTELKDLVTNFTEVGADNVTNPAQLPNVLVNTTFGAIVNATAQVAATAVNLHAQVTAPIVSGLANIAAPILRLDSRIAAPLIVAGGPLTQPIVIGGIQAAGPLLKLGQIGLRHVNEATEPFTSGFGQAVDPITQALQPVIDATQPIHQANAQAFADVPDAVTQTLKDNEALEQTVDQLKRSVDSLVTVLTAFASQKANSTA